MNWSAAGIVLQAGVNVLTVTAHDAAGNVTSDVITVTYSVPLITITSPVSTPTYATSASPVALAGTAGGAFAVAIVTWANDRGGAGTATGTTAWTIPAVPLQSGVNVITVTVQDAPGNTNTDTLTITYTPVSGPLLPILPPTRPKSVSWLLDIGGVHVATRDCELGGVVYRRGIVTVPSVDRRLDDSLYGFQDVSRARVELTMRSEWTSLWTSEYRGVPATLRRHDWRTNVTVTELDAAVENVARLPGRIAIDLVDLDLSVFETDLPRLTITPTFYGHTACPASGDTEQKIFGNVSRVPLPYVRDDVVGGNFWYLLSVGTGYTVNKVERDLPSPGQYKSLVAGEYQVRTDLVTNRTLIRTFVRQLNGAGGGFHKLFADVVGPVAERNFARAVRWCFEDPTWGLGETIDDANWDAAEADLPAGLFCDGVINQQMPARDWIDKLLIVRGMRPTRGPNGWRLAVDKAPATAAMHLGDGPGPGPRTMLRAGVRRRPTPRDQVSVYRLRGGFDLVEEKYRTQSADRIVGPLNTAGRRVGVERSEENPFLRNPTSLDMTACYRAKRLAINSADRIEGAEATEEARTVEEGTVIRVTSPLLDVTDLEYQVVQTRKGRGRHEIGTLVRYTGDPYIYDPLPLAIPPVIDQSPTPPGAQSLTFVSTAAEVTSDGTTVAFIVVRIVVPTTPAIDSAIIDYRRTGTTNYGGTQTVVGEGTHDLRIGGLQPGLSYDFRARTKSGAQTGPPLTLGPVVAAGDATAPSAPTLVTPRQSGSARIVEVQVSAALPPDWGVTVLLRNTTNTPATATEHARGKVSRFTDRNVNYDTTYFYWCRVGDNTFAASGVTNITGATSHPNLSGMSPVSSVVVQKSQTVDYGPGTVTPEIRAPLLTFGGVWGSYTLPAGGFQTGTFAHGQGRIPSIQTDSGHIAVALRIFNITTTTFSYVLINEDPGNPASGNAVVYYF
jgi:hypothetical protein